MWISLFLSAIPLSQAAGLADTPSQRILLGASPTFVGAFGDVDLQGDGYDDILLVDGTGLHLYRGTPRGLRTSTFSVRMPSSSVTGAAPAGDVNGDGVDDALVLDSTGGGGRGTAWLLMGSSTGTPRRGLTRYGAPGTTAYGKAGAGVGDVNGDGYDDWAVAMTLSTGEDAVYVYQGGTTPGTLLATLTGLGDVVDAWAGAGGSGGGVERAGDVNGDGYGDIAIGVHADASGDDRVLLFYGGPSGLSAATTLTAPWAYGGNGGGLSQFGGSISPGGDIDGDGYDDLVVSASGEAYFYGSIYVFWGDAGGLTLTNASVALGEFDGGLTSVWAGATLDGTPGDDVYTMGYSSFQSFGGSDAGLTWIDLLWIADEATTFASPMYSTYAGDVNGDGCSDGLSEIESWDTTTWTVSYQLALYEGDCS